jgi:hypothetical protein
MDERTTLRELDEVIARSRQATEREAKLVEGLPPCTTRSRKERTLRALREHLQRLRGFRSLFRARKRPGAPLN